MCKTKLKVLSVRLQREDFSQYEREQPYACDDDLPCDQYETDEASSYAPSTSDSDSVSSLEVLPKTARQKEYQSGLELPSTSDSDLVSSLEVLPKTAKQKEYQSGLELATQTRAKRTTKKHCCVYCGGLFTKVPRHMESKHYEKLEVQNALKLEKGSLSRKRAWLQLQKDGDYKKFKVQMETSDSTNEVNVITLRRLQHRQQPTIKDYAICPKCKGVFTKSNLKNHIRNICDPNKRCTRRIIKPNSLALSLKIHPKANDLVKKYLFSQMRDDKVVRAISNDVLLIVYANNTTLKYRHSVHHYKMIRNQLRHMGDILAQVKALNTEVTDLTSMYNPKFFDDVIKAVHIDAGLNIETGKYQVPTRATSACDIIQKLGDIAITEAIKENNYKLQQEHENFMKLLKTLKNSLVNRTAVENVSANRRHKKVCLPSNEMVNKIFTFVNLRLMEELNTLSKSFNSDAWSALTESVLVHILIFNRRRPGEIERALLCDYANLGEVDQEFKSSLTEADKGYASSFCRFVMRGKLMRPVSVVIHYTIKRALDLLIKCRTFMGINSSNEYLFAKPSERGLPQHIQADLALKKLLAEGNFPIDCNITATKLRKHLATVVATLKTNDDTVTDNVSDFMGHEKNIHKNVYRQVPVARDVIQVGQILMTAVGGGQSIQELTTPKMTAVGGGQSIQELTTPTTEIPVESQACADAPALEAPNPCDVQDSFSAVVATFDTFESSANSLDSDNEVNIPEVENEVCQDTTRNGRCSGWDEDQNKACVKFFNTFFKTGQYPSTGFIRQVCSEVPCLNNRTPRKIKAHLQFLKRKKTRLF